MPIHGITRTREGRWAVLFRRGGNALFRYKGEWVESPVLANDTIDDRDDSEMHHPGTLKDMDPEQHAAAQILLVFKGGMLAYAMEEESRPPYTPY